MASATINTGSVFPTGTTVSAYTNIIDPGVGGTDLPIGAAVATGTVDAAGVVTLTGLADATTYTLIGLVNGITRNQSFTTPRPAVTVNGISDVPGLQTSLTTLQTNIDNNSTSDRAYADTVGGAVELGYAAITANFTTATTGADVTGLAITVTVGARPILLVMAGTLASSAGAGVMIANLQEGATVIGQLAPGPFAAGATFPFWRAYRVAPSAGSHTYKVNIASFSAGTVTLSAAAANPASIQALQI